MSSRILGVSTPVLLAGAVVLAIVIGAAVALALGSGDDSVPATPTASPTATASAATPAPPVPSPSATPQPATPVPPTATVAASEVWSIEFHRSGGFAGLIQSLTLSSDGQARYEDMRAQTVKTGTLSAADLTEMRALIDSSGFFSQAASQDAPCADCFNLSIAVTLDGQSHTVEAVDIAVDVALKPLVDKLTALLQSGLGQ